jgi:hypothetical protein
MISCLSMTLREQNSLDGVAGARVAVPAGRLQGGRVNQMSPVAAARRFGRVWRRRALLSGDRRMYLQMSLILRLPFGLCRCASAAAPSSKVQLSADLRAGSSYAASAPSAAQEWDLYSA